MGRTTPTLDSDLIRKLSFVLGINPQPYLSVKPSTALQMLCELLGCGGPRRTLPQLCKYIRLELFYKYVSSSTKGWMNVISMDNATFMEETNDVDQIRVETSKSAHDTIEALIVSLNTVPTESNSPSFIPLDDSLNQSDARDG
ncbi:hypothetical protein BLNAU_23128 [Blattamonas nauphoetae]|uniref:Uncharacterized protein n=1 Tax=Blattamonas nauphoetae TaxID=2049346 RepID=A0ABQ9WR16_9EUKA|nr:hypothetical protein BLNAU_23128 [Blattamonas nauphoetae]